MSTTPQDLIKNSSTEVGQFSNAIGNTFHSGDMVYVDTKAVGTSTYNIFAADTEAHMATFAGVVQGTYDTTNYSVYGAGDTPEQNGYSVQRSGVWAPYGTSGETYFPGQSVYLGADAQTITTGTSANTHVVGYVYTELFGGPGCYATGTLASTVSTVAATGLVATGLKTTQVLCWINPQFPAATNHA